MRMRHKKHEKERMEIVSPLLITEETPFPYHTPFHLEIGCGKGGFISALAEKHPETNFLAVEKVSSVIVLAMEKVWNKSLKNVRFFSGDITKLETIAPEASVECIYLNFSDPWPRCKHAKRRLTAPSFLALYKKLLTQDGKIVMKTDNVLLFDYSLETLSENGFILESVTRDLHSLSDPENIVTEYEQNFSSQGIPICRVIAKKK